MNQWRECTSESLEVVSAIEFERHPSGKWVAWFNQPTWERWQEILIEINQELERRQAAEGGTP